MKIVEKTLLKACAYTVMLLSVLYIFGSLGNYEMGYINFSTFSVIAVFGFIISMCDLIFKIEKFHTALRILIHYFVLLFSFIILFSITGNFFANSQNKFLSGALIFTAFYAVLFIVVYILRKITTKIDLLTEKELIKKNSKKSAVKEYKPLYKNEDQI